MPNIIPFPEYIELKEWAAELIRIYKNDRLPILQDEDDWREWADIVVGSGSLRNKNLPSATEAADLNEDDSFESWEEWAKAVYVILNKDSV